MIGRELRVLQRSRSAAATLAVLLAVAWMPALVLPLRAGTLGLATLSDAVPLTLAIAGVVLPLVGLLAGAEAIASEIDDGSLVSVVTLPIGRVACFAGKWCGRVLMTAALYALAFGSSCAAMAAAHGLAGAPDYFTVAAGGLLLLLSATGLGLLLGAGAAGRLRAFGAALVLWLVLVFVIDALLLAAVVATAPPPPASVGAHGHTELAAPIRRGPESRQEDGGGATPSPAWWMALSPVDLYRLTALLGPTSRSRLDLALGQAAGSIPWAPLGVGWGLWLGLPPAVGVWRFRRAILR
ncbi:MAG TPA: ABC transporter permease subunit [Thermoanaerobaculia bacterium]|nr:ABC transporter permease subunit [Thermoanaerobaculia bacterium]